MKCLFTNIQKQQNVLKSSLLFKKIQTSRVNNSRILRLKIAKFSGYCFYMKPSIWWNFQICISVPLNIIWSSLLFRLVFSRNAKKTHTDQIILQTFVFCLNWNCSQTFEYSSYKKVFPRYVYHWYYLFR